MRSEGRQAIPSEPVPAPVKTEPEKTQVASQIGKSVPHEEPDPVLRAANFIIIDRSAETRTIQIDVPRT